MLDPRIRRTRQMLHEAFVRLLNEKSFTDISVQDVTDAASVNRATFYAHYSDKFVFLEATSATLFADLLEKRAVTFDRTCNSALSKIFLGITDLWSVCLVTRNMQRASIPIWSCRFWGWFVDWWWMD